MGAIQSVYGYYFKLDRNVDDRYGENEDDITDEENMASDSISSFDQKCDVCDGIKYVDEDEMGADKYCKQCQQYLCRRCCIHHQKGGVTKHHMLIETSEATKTIEERPLFERKLLPLRFIDQVTHKLSTYYLIDLIYIFTPDMLFSLVRKNTHRPTTYGLLFQNPDNKYKQLECDYDTYGQLNSFKQFSYKPRKSCIVLCGSRSINTFELFERQDSIVDSKLVFETAMDSTCYAIAVFNNHFAVLIELKSSFPGLPKWQIQCITYDGKFVQQICYDGNGEPLFSEPKFLTTNIEKNILYVSDSGYNSVISLDVDGNILFRFKHDDMKSPDGMCVDDEDNIYVACETNLFQINKNGKDYRVLLQTTKSRLRRIAFNNTERTLAIYEKNSMKIEILSFAK